MNHIKALYGQLDFPFQAQARLDLLAEWSGVYRMKMWKWANVLDQYISYMPVYLGQYTAIIWLKTIFNMNMQTASK